MAKVHPAFAAIRWAASEPPTVLQGPVRPLVVGVHKVLGPMLANPDTDRPALAAALRWFVNTVAYQRATLAPGAVRIGVDGQPAGEITDADRQCATARFAGIESRRRAKEAAARQSELEAAADKPQLGVGPNGDRSMLALGALVRTDGGPAPTTSLAPAVRATARPGAPHGAVYPRHRWAAAGKNDVETLSAQIAADQRHVSGRWVRR